MFLNSDSMSQAEENETDIFVYSGYLEEITDSTFQRSVLPFISIFSSVWCLLYTFIIVFYIVRSNERRGLLNTNIYNFFLCYVVYAIIILPATTITNIAGKWIFGQMVCIVFDVVVYLIPFVISLSLSVFYILLLVEMLTGRRINRPFHSVAIASSIWILGLIVLFPIRFQGDVDINGVCRSRIPLKYHLASFTASFIAPIIVVLFLSITLCAMRGISMSEKMEKQSATNTGYADIARAVYIESYAFILLWSPIRTLKIVTALCRYNNHDACTSVPDSAIFVCILIEYFNVCLMPFLWLPCQTVRRSLQAAVCHCGQRPKRRGNSKQPKHTGGIEIKAKPRFAIVRPFHTLNSSETRQSLSPPNMKKPVISLPLDRKYQSLPHEKKQQINYYTSEDTKSLGCSDSDNDDVFYDNDLRNFQEWKVSNQAVEVGDLLSEIDITIASPEVSPRIVRPIREENSLINQSGEPAGRDDNDVIRESWEPNDSDIVKSIRYSVNEGLAYDINGPLYDWNSIVQFE